MREIEVFRLAPVVELIPLEEARKIENEQRRQIERIKFDLKYRKGIYERK